MSSSPFGMAFFQCGPNLSHDVLHGALQGRPGGPGVPAPSETPGDGRGRDHALLGTEADLDPPRLQLGEEHGEADPTDRQQLIDQPLDVRGLTMKTI